MKVPAILALAPLLVAATAPAPLHFSVGGVKLALPIPKGFCTPTGKLLDRAKARTAPDGISVTHIVLYGCSPSGELDADRSLIIYTSNRLIAPTVTRAELLAAAGSAFDRPDFAARLNARLEHNQVKQQYHLSLGTIAPLGRDTMCAYFGGMGGIKDGRQIDTAATGGCLTATAGKAFIVEIMHRTKDDKEVFSLVKLARATAETVQPDTAS